MRTLQQTERINRTEEIREAIRSKVAELIPCLRDLPPEEIEHAEHLLSAALEDAKRKSGKLKESIKDSKGKTIRFRLHINGNEVAKKHKHA